MNDVLELFLIMLSVSSPVLIIVLVVQYFRYRALVAQRSAESAREAAALRNGELEREVAELRQRVEVLEAIVTDDKYDLGRKIASL